MPPAAPMVASQSAALTKQFVTLLAANLGRIRPTQVQTQLTDGVDQIHGDGELKKICLDSAFRQVITHQIITLDSLPEPNLAKCQRLVEVAIQAAQLDLCGPTAPIVVLSDIFDLLTLEGCQSLFACVENNVKVWREPKFFPVIKNNLLRICNDLLRRLSRTQNTAFCGRILVFLAKFFPFSDRSGLNVISEFNLDNVTVFSESSEQFDQGQKDAVVIEEDGRNLNIDYALYRKFWQLQDFFRSPTQCYEKLKWKTFSTFANDVLNTFHSFKLDAVSGKKQRKPKSAEDVDMEAGLASVASGADQYFAKYLTNQNLLQLQLSDSNFRRYVLIQFLILFQYLQSSVKFKSDSDVLTDEQTRWIQNAMSRIYSLMKETPPEGATFAKSVEHILNREKQWNAWKNEGCKTFRDDSSALAAHGAKSNSPSFTLARSALKRKLGDEIKEATQAKRFLMGNKNLTDLWNLCPDNLKACSAPERDFLPSMKEYFEDALDQLNPENQVEEDYKKVNDGSWGWRALRLLAKKSPHFFTYGNNPIAKLPDYLEQMLRKMSKEIGSPLSLVSKEGQEQQTNGASAEKETPVKAGMCSKAELEQLAEKIGEHWKKLAPKLGASELQVQEIESDDAIKEDKDRAMKLFMIWMELEQEGATVEEMLYILSGLKMKDLADGVFTEVSSA